MTKLQNRFSQRFLNDIFTVDIPNESDARSEENSNSIKMKCMPNSYPNVIKSIDTMYKVFAQTFIDSRKEGTLNLFVCDFVQDANGRFHFLKIDEYATDMKPVCSENWKVSTKFIDRVQDKDRLFLESYQMCSAQILCKNPDYADFMKHLEASCRKHEAWHDEFTWRYPTIEYKHITKYKAEQRIGVDGHKSVHRI